MKRMLLVPLAILLKLNALRVILLILFRRIVAALALCASKRNQRSHRTTSFSKRGYGSRTPDVATHYRQLSKLLNNLCHTT
jgi:hypothetical protein